jgi:hypothetical protein
MRLLHCSAAIRTFAAASAATLAVVPPCSAQHAIEITPFVGAYLPGAARATASYGCFSVDTSCLDSTTVGQHNAAMGGVQLTAWFGRRFAAEMGVAYSPSRTVSRTSECGCTAIGGGGCSGCSTLTASDASSRVVTGSARVLFTLRPSTLRHASPYGVAGIGVFHRSGPGVQAAEQTVGTAVPSTDWGPLIGVGVRVPVTSAFVPRAEFVLAEPGWGHRFGDLVFSLGLSKTLVGQAPSVQTQNSDSRHQAVTLARPW